MSETGERPHITVETMPERRREIGTLREQRGKEQEALGLIRDTRSDAVALGLHEDVVDLYWEEFLVGRHMDNLDMMKTAATAAGEYIERFDVESKRPRSNRFMGVVLLEEGDFRGAENHFRRGIELFEQMDDPAERVNALELRGYLAETFIWGGRVSEGIKEGLETFDEFEKGDGESLRGRDPYTWAVWKSGVAIKMWDTVLGGNTPITDEERQRLMQALDESEEAINSTPPEKIWGDFSIRGNQIAAIRHQISNH